MAENQELDAGETGGENHLRSRARGARSVILAVGAALGMTLAGLGIASAQTTPETDPPAAEAEPGYAQTHNDHAHRHCHVRTRLSLQVVAKTIGISAEELMEALAEGKSIAEVAEANGVDVDEVVNALLNQARERLAQKVEAGTIAQVEMDERLERLERRITEFVNREGFPGPRFHRRFRPGPDPAAESALIS